LQDPQKTVKEIAVRAHISGKKVEATPAQLSFPFPHAGEWLKALSNVQALYAGGPFDFASRHQRERDEDIQGDPDSADATSALLSAQLELVELFWRTWFETASKACVSVLVAVAGCTTAAQTKLLEIPTMGSPIRHITEVIVREAVRDRAGPIRR
jgi:hypothetical protein